jgi:hypothetical protein
MKCKTLTYPNAGYMDCRGPLRVTPTACTPGHKIRIVRQTVQGSMFTIQIVIKNVLHIPKVPVSPELISQLYLCISHIYLGVLDVQQGRRAQNCCCMICSAWQWMREKRSNGLGDSHPEYHNHILLYFLWPHLFSCFSGHLSEGVDGHKKAFSHSTTRFVNMEPDCQWDG